MPLPCWRQRSSSCICKQKFPQQWQVAVVVNDDRQASRELGYDTNMERHYCGYACLLFIEFDPFRRGSRSLSVPTMRRLCLRPATEISKDRELFPAAPWPMGWWLGSAVRRRDERREQGRPGEGVGKCKQSVADCEIAVNWMGRFDWSWHAGTRRFSARIPTDAAVEC